MKTASKEKITKLLEKLSVELTGKAMTGADKVRFEAAWTHATCYDAPATKQATCKKNARAVKGRD